MAHSRTSHRRLIRRCAIVVVLAAAVTAGYLATRPNATTPVVAASIFKTATVEEGTLGTSESLDGSVVLSAVTSVLHRIEGQTSSSGTTPSASSGAPTAVGVTSAGVTSGAATPAPASAEAVAATAAAVDDCDTSPSTTVPAASGSTPTTEVVPTGSTPSGSTPSGSVPSGQPGQPPGTAPATTPPTTSATTSATTTATTTTTTATTSPAGTAPTGSAPTTPTTPGDCTTATTTPTPTGGAVPPGGAVPTGGAPTSRSGGTGTSGTGTSGTSTRVTQVVTSVIADGSDVTMGTVLYSVESSPVVALPGSLPAWRTLDTSSEDGIDVLQLEMDLTALGYDPDSRMTIDTEFDSDTKAVVKAWQAGYGMEVTGSVALGSVVFVGGETTVAGVAVAVGDEVGDGDSILSLSAASQQVVIDVPDGAEAYMVPGLSVKVGSGDGTVTLLRSLERDGSVVVQAVITPAAAIEGADNGSSVKVTVTTTSLDGVLLVPTEALVSRLDGSYAVQVVADDGTSTFVDVELLGVSGSAAGVRGEGLTAGSEVLQPV